MARQEQDREDLLREATALVQRAELDCASFAETVVVGFRRDGSGSLFFGADPVYQFNTHGQLRRAYKDGLLIKAERGRLASLDRRRREGRVELVRHDLDDAETSSLLADAAEILALLREDFRQQNVKIVGQVPADEDVVGRIIDWLESLQGQIEIASRPNVG